MKEQAHSERCRIALTAPGCERLREWAAIGPVQRAAVEEFAQALVDRECAPMGEADALEVLAGMVNDGKVLLEAWVFQDDVQSYRVICRGRDGWRKSADAKTLDAAIREADEAAWRPPSASGEQEDGND